MAGAPVQGLIAIGRCRQSPGKPGLFLWAFSEWQPRAGWGGSPGPCPNLPGGGFSGAVPAAFF